jgi:hypothetical protein
MSNEDLKLFLEDLRIYLEQQEGNIALLKRQIDKLLDSPQQKEAKVALSELTFTILKWEAEEGTKLGKFEIAYKSNNLADQWQHVFNILRNNKAVINARFHENGYAFAYWVYEKYPDRIFRKKLGEAKL